MSYLFMNIPTRIHYGTDALSLGLKKESNLFSGNVMLVTGKSAMKRLGYLDQVVESLYEHTSIDKCITFNGISPNPKVSEINSAIQNGIKEDVRLVIGLGGGSSIDAAKAIAVGVGARCDINAFVLGERTPGTETLPIVAIPTTAGTGSELSRGAIVSFPEKNVKTGLRGDVIFPTVAIVNPEFTYKLPKKITLETGFDVLTHAIETFISKKANRFTEMLSLEAIEIVSEYLPRLCVNLNDKEARQRMSYASMIMGINLGNASTCLPHRLQYPIGAKTDTSHGAGLACLYKAWISNTYDYSTEKFNIVGSILSGSECGVKEDVVKAITSFMECVEVNYNLSDLGLNLNDVDQLVSNVRGSIENDPGSSMNNIIETIYRMSFNSEK